MGLAEDLAAQVASTFADKWTITEGKSVPDTSKLTFANTTVKLTGAVLYSDLASSTALVDSYSATFAAEIYKTFLYCAARIIASEGGEVTAYDGDRIMAVFVGGTPCTDAVVAGLKINSARLDIILPALRKAYPTVTYVPQHVTGIDISDLHAAKTGARGANDLVWVGKAANHAAKLSALDPSHATCITSEVYGKMTDRAKFSNGVNMWTEANWTAMGRKIYRSTYKWSVS